MAPIVNRKIKVGPRTGIIRGPIELEGDELVGQEHHHRNALNVARENRLLAGILVDIDDDSGFAIGPAGANARAHDAWLDLTNDLLASMRSWE